MKLSGQSLLLTSAVVAGSAVPWGCKAAGKAKPQQTTARPNIVLIIADDCRMRDLGCYGSPDSKTPNIDRLAAEGLKFSSFYQATAMSSPTRQCMLTGLYPVRSGAYPNHTFIKDDVKTLPFYLKNAGYRVAIQGKRHFNPEELFPFEYLSESKDDIDAAQIEPFLADVAASKEPFFLYVASHDPHEPWTRGDQSLFDENTLTLPPTLVDTPETRLKYRNYLAEINNLDNGIGVVDGLIRKYGLGDNTIFIFTSEQGHSFPFAKWTCYDAGLHTAFIVRWKDRIRPGSVTDSMCEYVDVTPTLIDIASGKVPEGLDGKSFLPVLEGRASKFKQYVYSIQTTRGIFSGSPWFGIRSVRDARYSYILNLTPDAEFSCLANKDKNTVWASWLEKAKSDDFARRQVNNYSHRPSEELYDMVRDPFQMNNIIDDPARAKDAARLRDMLAQWMAQQGDLGQQTEMEALSRKWKGGGGDD